jgi:hypothetical protein
MKKKFFLIALSLLPIGCNRNSPKWQKYYLNQDYKGVVIDKYQDWDDHGRVHLLIFNYNKDTIDLIPEQWRPDNIWDYVRVGDSIIKPINQLEITVKRKDWPPEKFRYQDVGLAL